MNYTGELLILVQDIAHGFKSNFQQYEKRLQDKSTKNTCHTFIFNYELIALYDNEDNKPSDKHKEYFYYTHCGKDYNTVVTTKWQSVEQLKGWLKSLKHYPRMNMGDDFKKHIEQNNLFNKPINAKIKIYDIGGLN